MRELLVDTNVLIALVDPKDALHARAVRDLGKLAASRFRLTSAVLCECVFALPRADQRGRLALLVDRLPLVPAGPDDEARHRAAVFAWLARYAEHEPDWADAELCVLAGAGAGRKATRPRVWTYDPEFRTVWRTPAGRRVPLAIA